MRNSEAGDVLLACLSASLTAEQRAALDATSQDAWAATVDLALQLRIGGLLQSRLSVLRLDPLLPADAAARLRNVQRATVGKNLRLSFELRTLLRAFADAGVPVIVLKGAFLAFVVYGNMGLRTVGDIDILVRQEHLPQVVNTLQTLGYGKSDAPDEQGEQKHHLPAFTRPGNIAPIEVHWRLFHVEPVASVSTNDLFERATPVVLADSPALAFAPEDLLLHMCCHAVYSHRLNQDVRFLADIAMIVAHYGESLNWQTLAERAGEWRCARGVYLPLYLAQQLLGAAIPPAALELLVPESGQEIPVDAFRTLYFAEEWTKFQEASPALASIVVQEQPLRRLWLSLRRIFISRDTISTLYKIPRTSPKIYLYYGRRAAELLRRYFTTVTGLEPEMTTQFQLQQQLLQWVEKDRI